MRCRICGVKIWHTIHGSEICTPCAIKANWCTKDRSDNRCGEMAPCLNCGWLGYWETRHCPKCGEMAQ